MSWRGPSFVNPAFDLLIIAGGWSIGRHALPGDGAPERPGVRSRHNRGRGVGGEQRALRRLDRTPVRRTRLSRAVSGPLHAIPAGHHRGARGHHRLPRVAGSTPAGALPHLVPVSLRASNVRHEPNVLLPLGLPAWRSREAAAAVELPAALSPLVPGRAQLGARLAGAAF